MSTEEIQAPALRALHARVLEVSLLTSAIAGPLSGAALHLESVSNGTSDGFSWTFSASSLFLPLLWLLRKRLSFEKSAGARPDGGRGRARLQQRADGGDGGGGRSLETGDGTILVDRTQLDQAVVNLVLNARDAISGAGEFRLFFPAV